MRDLVFTIVGVVILLVVGCVGTSVYHYARSSSAQMKDSQQVRSVQQAMSFWAIQHDGLYPLPSIVDAASATVDGEAESKDTTANIMSLLIYHGGISATELISIEENNPKIRQCESFEFDNPSKAVRPKDAAWDPGFSADFTSPAGGNVSYAHIPPVGARRALWRDFTDKLHPIVGNRGPEVASLKRGDDGRVMPALALTKSRTFAIHGSRHIWEGNIAFNDGHVEFAPRVVDTDGYLNVRYKDTAGKIWADCLFFDEPEDAADTNAWMSIWIKAGNTKGEFKSIWD